MAATDSKHDIRTNSDSRPAEIELDHLGSLSDFRANLVRVAAIGGFYGIHLLNYAANSESGSIPGLSAVATFLQLKGGEAIAARIHLLFSLIALMWVGWALLIHRSLYERRLPFWLPYATVGLDTVLLTAILALTAGAQNPLVCGYLLIVMLAALRVDLKLVRCATVGGLVGLMTLLAAAKWPRGLLTENPLPVIPRHYQLILVFAIILAGLIAGQWVRMTSKILNEDRESRLREGQRGKFSHG